MFNGSKHGTIHGLEAFKMGGRETLEEPPNPNLGKERCLPGTQGRGGWEVTANFFGGNENICARIKQ